MKRTDYTICLAAFAAASSLHSQTLDNVPTDAADFTLTGPPAWSWSDPDLGIVTATYITDNDTGHNAWRVPSGNPEPGLMREGYFAYRNNPNGATDITGTEQLVFSWTTPVNTLEFSLGDFDENNNGPAVVFSDSNLLSIALGDIGQQPSEQGYVHSILGTTLTLDSRGPDAMPLTNARIYNSIEVILTGTAMTSFTMEGESAHINALEIGGLTATTVPEPSTALLGALAGLGLLARRRR
ncbi:MAG: PEP-CTERM sorting domain-containing protein [Roseibacillus sp.]